MSDTLPLIAQKGPYMVAVEAGKSYWWCACGRSQRQPFCDGSHKGTNFAPYGISRRNRRGCMVLRLQAQRWQTVLRRHARYGVSAPWQKSMTSP